MPIRIPCPYCATEVDVAEDAHGKQTTCSRCGESFSADAPMVVLPVRPPLQTAMQPERSFCQACGKSAPTAQVTFYEHIGAVVLMFHRHVSGNLCRECIDRYFKEYTLKTLLLGWWGMISFFITPFCLLMNFIAYAGSRKVPSAAAGLGWIDPSGAAIAQDAQRGSARGKVLGPAIGLIVTGVLGVLWAGLGLTSNLISLNEAAPARAEPLPVNPNAKDPDKPERPETPEEKKARLMQMAYLWSGQGIISVLVLLGAIQMLRMKMYWFALAGSVLASIPLIGPCCCVSLPFGVWGIAVLCMADVRRGFV